MDTPINVAAAISNTGQAISNILFAIIVVILIVTFILVFVIIILGRMKYNQYKCVIFEWDGTGNVNETYDKAGIFVDGKTKNKRFFLKKNNVGLSPDNIPYIPNYSKGGFTPKRTVYLLRSGLKNFRFLSFNIGNPYFSINVGEEDVNWAINSYERSKKAFIQNTLVQVLPYIGMLVMGLIIIILVYILLSKFDVLAKVADSLTEVATILRDARSGTTVVN